MHAIQRIFYFHLPSWIAMFSAFSIAFYANVAYLVTRKRKWDALGVSGVGSRSHLLHDRPGHRPALGAPGVGHLVDLGRRLTSTFILWLLYIAYLLLRGLLEDPEKKASLSAIFGIFASLDIPLVYLSNRLWRTQHPQPVIARRPQFRPRRPRSRKVLLLCVVAVFCVMILVLVDRYRLEMLRNECAELRFEIESPRFRRWIKWIGRESARAGKGRTMKNFEFLFTAWMVVWAGLLRL